MSPGLEFEGNNVESAVDTACEELNIDLSHSVLVGDKTSDLEAARRAGITKILAETGHAGKDAEYDVEPDYRAKDLMEAAKWVLARERD